MVPVVKLLLSTLALLVGCCPLRCPFLTALFPGVFGWLEAIGIYQLVDLFVGLLFNALINSKTQHSVSLTATSRPSITMTSFAAVAC